MDSTLNFWLDGYSKLIEQDFVRSRKLAQNPIKRIRITSRAKGPRWFRNYWLDKTRVVPGAVPARAKPDLLAPLIA